jgi:hypothetical protein
MTGEHILFSGSVLQLCCIYTEHVVLLLCNDHEKEHALFGNGR